MVGVEAREEEAEALVRALAVEIARLEGGGQWAVNEMFLSDLSREGKRGGRERTSRSFAAAKRREKERVSEGEREEGRADGW